MSEPFDPYYQWLGIPPENGLPDHYRLLGIREFEADATIIRAAADQRLVYLRTFQLSPQSDLVEKLLNEVAAAKVCLLDPQTKARYDRGRKTRQEPLGPTPTGESAGAIPLAETGASLGPVVPPPARSSLFRNSKLALGHMRAVWVAVAISPLLLVGVVLLGQMLVASTAARPSRPVNKQDPVATGSSSTRKPRLVPPQSPPSWSALGGILTLTVDPSGATVKALDASEQEHAGYTTGATGLSLWLPPGTYRLRMEKAGFDPVARELAVQPGSEQTIAVHLKPAKPVQVPADSETPQTKDEEIAVTTAPNEQRPSADSTVPGTKTSEVVRKSPRFVHGEASCNLPEVGLVVERWGEGASDRENCVRVIDVYRDSPALRARFEKGDLIVSIDQQPIRSINDINDLLSNATAGSAFEVMVERSRERKVLLLQVPP